MKMPPQLIEKKQYTRAIAFDAPPSLIVPFSRKLAEHYVDSVGKERYAYSALYNKLHQRLAGFSSKDAKKLLLELNGILNSNQPAQKIFLHFKEKFQTKFLLYQQSSFGRKARTPNPSGLNLDAEIYLNHADITELYYKRAKLKAAADAFVSKNGGAIPPYLSTKLFDRKHFTGRGSLLSTMQREYKKRQAAAKFFKKLLKDAEELQNTASRQDFAGAYSAYMKEKPGEARPGMFVYLGIREFSPSIKVYFAGFPAKAGMKQCHIAGSAETSDISMDILPYDYEKVGIRLPGSLPSLFIFGRQINFLYLLDVLAKEVANWSAMLRDIKEERAADRKLKKEEPLVESKGKAKTP